MAAQAKKVQFHFGHDDYEVYTNGKEYGPNKIIYLSVTRVGGKSEKKGAYSLVKEEFTQWGAGELDLMKAATKALDITK